MIKPVPIRMATLKDAGHVAGGEDELPGGAEGHRPGLGPPQRVRGLLPQLAVPVPDLGL